MLHLIASDPNNYSIDAKGEKIIAKWVMAKALANIAYDCLSTHIRLKILQNTPNTVLNTSYKNNLFVGH